MISAAPTATPTSFYLNLQGIEHHKTEVRTFRTNGFVERFSGTVLDAFFQVKMRQVPSAPAQAEDEVRFVTPPGERAPMAVVRFETVFRGGLRTACGRGFLRSRRR